MPLHPSMVHLPLGLALVAPFLAFGIAIAFRRGLLPRRAWWTVVGVQVALVAGAFVAMRSGEAEEDAVERLVSHAAIEAHEEAALVFFWAAVAALALSAVVGFLRSERVARPLALVAAIAAFAVTALGVNVGRAGGELVYVHGAAATYARAPAGTTASPATYEKADDEDHEDED